jgi:hypothetical protein
VALQRGVAACAFLFLREAMANTGSYLRCQKCCQKINLRESIRKLHLELVRSVACYSSKRRLVGERFLPFFCHGGHSVRVALLQTLNFSSQLLLRCTKL